MIGFGSIGRGTLPLIDRHFGFDRSRLTVIDPADVDQEEIANYGGKFLKLALTRDNYREVLGPLLTEGSGQGFCVNLSVDTSSLEIMEFCREIGALYIDTVVEPWAGFYFDDRLGPEARSNYALREGDPGRPPPPSWRGDGRLLLRRQSRHGVMVRQAGADRPQAGSRAWRRRAEDPPGMGRAGARLGVKGIHIAERDTQRSPLSEAPRCLHQHLVGRGLHLEGLQPAELGFGTHEKWMPDNAGTHATGCGARSTCCSPAPTPASAAGARRPARNSASWSPTMSRSRSPTI